VNFKDRLYATEPLPHSIQKKLVVAAQQGSKLARDTLISSNLRFIGAAARKMYRSDNYELDDLIGEGVAGMNVAIDRFNVDVNNNFLSYAIWWVKQSMCAYIRDKSRLIRQPAHKQSDIGIKVCAMSAKLGDMQGDSTVEDLIEQSTFEFADDTIDEPVMISKIGKFLDELPHMEGEFLRHKYGIGRPDMTLVEFVKKCYNISIAWHDAKENI
jgi:RNA polymerase sigma factor (sigma-70 family)